ncbi:MAG: DUF3006 domain-containing protein [Clostridia bacterium]|nr:DUF3006 domain-containing protein [Clostridia bacterium]
MEKQNEQVYTVDRVEDHLAVCQNGAGENVHVELSRLPDGTCEGSILRLGADGVWVLDAAAEEQTRARVRGKLNRLFGRK